MKKNSLMIAFCLLLTPIFSQTNPYEKDIKTVYDTIAAAGSRGDWDKVLDHTYPKIFTIAPREQMRKLISKTFTDTSEIKVTIVYGRPDSVSVDTLLVDNELFVILYDSKKMQIVLKDVLAEPEKDHKFTIDMMKGIFTTQYGEENVMYDEKTATFDILKKKGVNLCSNMSNTRAIDSWTIMEIKFDQPALLQKLLPNEVIEWIKLH